MDIDQVELELRAKQAAEMIIHQTMIMTQMVIDRTVLSVMHRFMKDIESCASLEEVLRVVHSWKQELPEKR